MKEEVIRLLVVDGTPGDCDQLALLIKNEGMTHSDCNGKDSQCAMYAVSILTELALAETKDLVAASHRLGFRFCGLMLNMATPSSDCQLCQALHRRESVIAEKFDRTFPTCPQVLIYRGGEPCGLRPLQELAQALYESPAEILHYV